MLISAPPAPPDLQELADIEGDLLRVFQHFHFLVAHDQREDAEDLVRRFAANARRPEAVVAQNADPEPAPLPVAQPVDDIQFQYQCQICAAAREVRERTFLTDCRFQSNLLQKQIIINRFYFSSLFTRTSWPTLVVTSIAADAPSR